MIVKTTPSARFDVHKLLASLGSPDQIIRRCLDKGLTAPGASTIRMWRHRERVPSDWIPTLLLIMPDDTNLRFFVQSAPQAQSDNPFA